MRRRGFTLFEMLIATSLMSLLLTLVYGSLHRAWLLRTAGHTQAEHDRLGRVVLRQFEQLVTQAAAPPSELPANAWDLDTAELAGRTGRMTPPTQPGRRPLPVDCGILGTRDTLIVFHDPTQHNHAPPLRPFTNQLSLLATNQPGALTLPTRISGPIDWQPLLVDRPRESSLLWADATTQRAGNAGPLQVSTPRFRPWHEPHTQLRYRYFDGQAWHDSWDTCEQRTNPRAVELVLTLGTSETARHYRAIVSLPRTTSEVLP